MVKATPRPLYPRERLGTQGIGRWVDPMAVMDRCGKSRPQTGIRSPDRPGRSESLYWLRYPGPLLKDSSVVILTDKLFLKRLFYECLNMTLCNSVTIDQCVRTLHSFQTWISSKTAVRTWNIWLKSFSKAEQRKTKENLLNSLSSFVHNAGLKRLLLFCALNRCSSIRLLFTFLFPLPALPASSKVSSMHKPISRLLLLRVL